VQVFLFLLSVCLLLIRVHEFVKTLFAYFNMWNSNTLPLFATDVSNIIPTVLAMSLNLQLRRSLTPRNKACRQVCALWVLLV